MRGKATQDIRFTFELNERWIFATLFFMEYVFVTELFNRYERHDLTFFSIFCFALLYFCLAKRIHDDRCIVAFTCDFIHIALYNLIFKSLLLCSFFIDSPFTNFLFNHIKPGIAPFNTIVFFLFVFRVLWAIRRNGRFVGWPRFGLQDMAAKYFPPKTADLHRPTGWLAVAGYACIVAAIGIGLFVSQIQGKKAFFLFLMLFAMLLLIPWLAKAKATTVDTAEAKTQAEQQAQADAALRASAERCAKAAQDMAEVATATVMRAELDLSTGYDQYHNVLMRTAKVTLKAEQAQAAAETARANAVAAVESAEATAAAAVAAKAAAEAAMQELVDQNRLLDAKLSESTQVNEEERHILTMYRKLPHMERLKWATGIKYTVKNLEFAYKRDQKTRERSLGLQPK